MVDIPFIGNSEETESEENNANKTDDAGRTPSQRRTVENLASNSINLEKGDAIELNENNWRRILQTTEFDEVISALSFNNVINNGLTNEIKNDISIHISPRERSEVIREINSEMRTLRKRYEEEQDQLQKEERELEYQLMESMKEVLQQGNHKAFNVSMYTSLHSENYDDLDEKTARIKNKLLETDPANTEQSMVHYLHKESMQSVSPIAKDILGDFVDDNVIDTKKWMMGGGVSAMMPFTTNKIMHDDGVEWGIHNDTDSPINISRWDLENGYNQLTIGKIGSGKSYATSLNLLRTYAARDDVTIVIIDPLNGFEAIRNILDGERITIGGSARHSANINPLNITPPSNIPEDDVEQMKREQERGPFEQRYRSAIEFFSKYFRKTGSIQNIKEVEDALQRALLEAYAQNGIGPDITTHSNPSPTIRDDLRPIVKKMVKEPQNATPTIESDIPEHGVEKFKQQAKKIDVALEKFEKGRQFEHLGGKGEIDISSGENDVIYINMEGMELGSTTTSKGESSGGLLLRILFEQIYERAKSTSDKVYLAIDEAHNLIRSSSDLEFLETAVRHSRHYDLAINFITQGGHEFLSDDRAKAIANLCSIKQIHYTELTEETAKGIDSSLRQSEVNFISERAKTGKDGEYSNAFMIVGDKKAPIKVISTPMEHELITIEEDRDGNSPSIEQQVRQVTEKYSKR